MTLLAREEIVVYKHSSTGDAAGVFIMTKEQLNDTLTSNNALRHSTKPIPRYVREVEVLASDLIPDAQREQYAHYPNQRSSIASVSLPNRVWMQRQLTATQFSELHILSDPETTMKVLGLSPDWTVDLDGTQWLKLL